MNRKPFFFCLAILFFSAINFSQAQNAKMAVSDETDLITYTSVVDLPNETKDELYHKAYTWCNTYYKNPSNVIRKKDVLNGVIECKGRFRITTPATKKSKVETAAGIVQYTLSLQFKDNKYRYTITKINWKQSSYYPIERWLEKEKDTYLPVYAEYLSQVDKELNSLISSLNETMSRPSPKSSDDW